MTDLPHRLRRTALITTAAALAGGRVLVAAEAVAARLRRYATPSLRLAMRTSIGPRNATPLRLALLGDATALGVGVDRVEETLGGQLARMLAEGHWRVELSSVAVAGSRSADLAPQVARALLGHRPDVAVIMIGAGDATALGRISTAATHLGAAVRRLRDAGVEVVVGTCPDLSAVRAFAPPLRQIYGWWGRRLAQAQTAAVHAAGGDVVDLGAETGAVFRADRGTLCEDGFHPSADGYRVWAHALYPAVVAAIHDRIDPTR